MDQNYWRHDISMFVFEAHQLRYEVNAVIGVVFGLLWGLCFLFRLKQEDSVWFKRLQTVGFWGVLVAVGLSIIKYVGGFRWYTAFFMLSVAFAYLVFRYWVQKGRLMMTLSSLDSYVNYVIVGLLVGARVFYLLVYNFQSLKADPLVIIRTWEGGLSFHGGLIGFIVSTLIYCYRFEVPFWHIADRAALCVPFGLFAVRIGNFMNGELYGRLIQRHIPWAMIFDATGGGPYPRHPSQLYESLGEGLIVGAILWSLRILFRSEGQISGLFLLAYGTLRYGIEFFREPDATAATFFNGFMTTGQLLCSLMIVGGGIIIFLNKDRVQDGSPSWQVRYSRYISERLKLDNRSM
jgi:phosphatidylglycerol:prolipoprotein diacylglycerol transferase